MSNREIKVIADRFYKGPQSLHLTKVLKITNGQRSEVFRVEIKRDSVDSQSYAKGEVFSKQQNAWATLVSLPISECACQVANPYEKAPLESNFQADAVRIFDEMTAIVGLDVPSVADVL